MKNRIHALNPNVDLQETRCNSDTVPQEIEELEGYHKVWGHSEKRGYSGVALFSKVKPKRVAYRIGNKEFDNDGRCVTADFKRFYIVSVYVPNSGEYSFQ